MPRPKTILQSDCPYHVSARCPNKEWFKIPMDKVWRIMSEQLCFITWVYSARIHAFVLMGNHFHLIISTPEGNLSVIMAHFMRETTRSLNHAAGRINQAYGSRHFRSVISRPCHFLLAYKYVYRNPVKAGLVEKCQFYKYSSLSFLLGDTPAAFPTTHDDTLFSDVEGTLAWLNRKPSSEDWLAVRKAMKHSSFRLAMGSGGNGPHHLESEKSTWHLF